MADKPKCSQCNQRDVFAKGLCSGCYGKNWRLARKAERAGVEVEPVQPRQLTSGVIEGEIIHDDEPAKVPETHLVATDPVQMKAAQGDMRIWLENKLTVLERDILEANIALNEARKNGWATGALTSARNRAVDDETFYNKVLAAVEAGHTIIPDFPIEVFAVRVEGRDRRQSNSWYGHPGSDTYLHRPLDADTLPAGAGQFRNPEPEVNTTNLGKHKDSSGTERTLIGMTRTGYPVGPIVVPSHVSRSAIMKSIAGVMAEKVFDQVGVCHPTIPVASTRRVNTSARRGDPLVIGQILRKRVGGGPQKCVSFIIAWYLNLDEL